MRNVLVIDDIASVRRSVEVALSRSGYKVAAVESLEAARPLLDETVFDLVITDILMPDHDGAAVIHEVRQKSPSTKILAMSGGGSLVPSEEALSYAAKIANATIRKPFDRSELLSAIEPLLEEREQ